MHLFIGNLFFFAGTLEFACLSDTDGDFSGDFDDVADFLTEVLLCLLLFAGLEPFSFLEAALLGLSDFSFLIFFTTIERLTGEFLFLALSGPPLCSFGLDLDPLD